MLFQELPPEILSDIGNYCTQADLVNLAIACPNISGTFIPGIYRCIVVDSIPRAMYGLVPFKQICIDSVPKVVAVSTVYTIAGLKRLLDTLSSHPENAAMVRSFSVRGNIGMCDTTLLTKFAKVIRNLSGLIELEWTACPELPPELLLYLPKDSTNCNHSLNSLCVDLAVRAGQAYPLIQFPNLRKFHVRPFLNSQALSWLQSVAHKSENLEELSLSRFLDAKPEVGSSFAFVGLSDVHQRHDVCAAIRSFFEGSVHKYRLKSLDLREIDTHENDAEILCRSVDLSELKVLKLTGSGREDEHNHGILSCITSSRPQLQKVEIDWMASYVATQSFLKNCCKTTLALRLTVREFPNRVLACLKRYCPALTHLDLYFKCEFNLEDLQPLSTMRSLKSLKLPFNYTVDSWEVAAELPELKVLELCWKTPAGSSSFSNDSSVRNANRSVNIGLLTSGIHDQWNDSQRSPLQCANIVESMLLNESIEYVIIDGHITPLRSHVSFLESYAL